MFVPVLPIWKAKFNVSSGSPSSERRREAYIYPLSNRFFSPRKRLDTLETLDFTFHIGSTLTRLSNLAANQIACWADFKNNVRCSRKSSLKKIALHITNSLFSLYTKNSLLFKDLYKVNTFLELI